MNATWSTKAHFSIVMLISPRKRHKSSNDLIGKDGI
jgi:hypothetical protein